jgi:chromate reductase
LLSIPALVSGGPQVVIGNIGEKVTNGMLVDQPSLHFASAALRQMISACRLNSPRLIA